MEQEMIQQILTAIKTDVKLLRKLKVATKEAGLLEASLTLRGIELTNFPQSEEEKKEREQAKHLITLFSMVGLNIPEDICWVINKTMAKYKVRRGNFDLKDAAEIRATKIKMYGE
jgi:hypothetical protein